MPNAYISGTGHFAPPTVVTNDDLITQFGIETNNEWIVQRTGIEERRFASDGMGTADMGYEAAKAAIAAAGIEPHDLDMILFATLSPDYAFPGPGVFVQAKLGLCDGPKAKFIPAMDIRAQCSGFMYGLSTADAMIRSGKTKHVLLIGAEKHSPGLDLSTEGRGVASLFGDGAGAVVVSATDENRGLRTWKMGADGRYADVLSQRIWDISKRPLFELDENGWGKVPPQHMWAQMNGKLVFKNAVERMAAVLMEVMMAENITGADVDLFLFHQANLRINQYLQNLMGVPDEKVYNNIQRYGNTTAATIPSLMAECVASGRLKPGMKVALAGFGSGFTWGSMIIDW